MTFGLEQCNGQDVFTGRDTIAGRKGKFELIGPDRLNNLYNEADENAKLEGFTIDHKEPGKSEDVRP
jgi:hypothetical protein